MKIHPISRALLAIMLPAVLALAACAPGEGPEAKSVTTSAAPVNVNRAAFRRVIDEGLNANNATVLDEVFAPTMVDHDLPKGTPPGPAGSKAKIAAFRTAFPDIRFTFEGEVAEGDKIAGRGYFTGTHTGSFQGMPPTGRSVKVRFMDVWRFENGKVVEYWGQPDVMGLMQQLGAVPVGK
jgi:predicted ester cyclase